MITPFFTLRQDDIFLYIDIKISHIRFQSTKIESIVEEDGQLFIFSLAPYYLRLRLPGKIVSDELDEIKEGEVDEARNEVKYDSSNESISFKYVKVNKGEEFKDLDLSSKLLARRGDDDYIKSKERESGSNGALIQDLSVKSNIINDNDNDQAMMDIDEAEDFDWEIKQSIPQNTESISIENPIKKYGFNNTYCDIIGVSIINGNDINEVSKPEEIKSYEELTEDRLTNENLKFDSDHYINDFLDIYLDGGEDFEHSPIKEIINWESNLKKQFHKWQKQKLKQNETETENKNENDKHSNIFPLEFTKEEQTQLQTLPLKKYFISNPKSIYLNLISFIFSFSYDYRTTQGDSTIESSWTIGKLSPQLSSLDSNFSTLKDVLITSTKRSLIYPLYRSWELSLKCWEDTYYIIRTGRRGILRCLLKIRELFRFHDIYYVYNKIWIDDYCTWLQIDSGANENVIRSLAHELRQQYTNLTKSDVPFEKTDIQMDTSDGNDDVPGFDVLRIAENKIMLDDLEKAAIDLVSGKNINDSEEEVDSDDESDSDSESESDSDDEDSE